jgi:hypothetical protein
LGLAHRKNSEYDEHHDSGQRKQVAGDELRTMPVVLGIPGTVAKLSRRAGIGVRRDPDQALREAAEVQWLTPQKARPRTEQSGEQGSPGETGPPNGSACPDPVDD